LSADRSSLATWWAEAGKLSLRLEVNVIMGQYFIAVNKTKKEYVRSWDIGGVAKLWEWCVNRTAGIFPYLLRKRNEGGGGDIYLDNLQYAARWAAHEVLWLAITMKAISMRLLSQNITISPKGLRRSTTSL
jgi:hypothetical protein